MTPKFRIASVLLGAGLLMPVGAFASTVAWEFDTASNPFNNGQSFVFGEVFTVNSNITVDYLGYFDSGNPANLTENHPVALYSSSGTLLASSTINSSAANTSANFAYNPISSIELFAGSTYVLEGVSGSVDPYTWNDAGFAVFAPITLLGNNYQNGGSLAFNGTGLVNDTTDGYWGANFDFSPAAGSPEPGSFLLLGTGLALAGTLGRKRFARK
jgi:hypothetical protein